MEKNETREITHDSCMKPRKSYKILEWVPGNHIWFLYEIEKIIYDPCKKSYPCMKLVWLPGNYTNHLWPCIITGIIKLSKSLFGWLWCIFYWLSAIAATIEVVNNYFNFCMKLVWLRGNHTNQIWPCMKSRKIVWWATRAAQLLLNFSAFQRFSAQFLQIVNS